MKVLQTWPVNHSTYTNPWALAQFNNILVTKQNITNKAMQEYEKWINSQQRNTEFTYTEFCQAICDTVTLK